MSLYQDLFQCINNFVRGGHISPFFCADFCTPSKTNSSLKKEQNETLWKSSVFNTGSFCHDIITTESSYIWHNNEKIYPIKIINFFDEDINYRIEKLTNLLKKFSIIYTIKSDFSIETSEEYPDQFIIVFKEKSSNLIKSDLMFLLKILRLSYFDNGEPIGQLVLSYMNSPFYIKEKNDLQFHSDQHALRNKVTTWFKKTAKSLYFFGYPYVFTSETKDLKKYYEEIKQNVAPIKNYILEKQKDIYICAYGSLRKGGYNFDRFPGVEYVCTTSIYNFALYDLGPYPCAVDKSGYLLIVDLLKVTPEAKERIDAMEIGAGYEINEVIVNDKIATIYVMKNLPKGATPIMSGDYIAEKKTISQKNLKIN